MKQAANKASEEDDMVIFAPIEEALKNNFSFVDPAQKQKIVNKPIIRYNPLKDIRASMGVAIWEND